MVILFRGTLCAVILLPSVRHQCCTLPWQQLSFIEPLSNSKVQVQFWTPFIHCMHRLHLSERQLSMWNRGVTLQMLLAVVFIMIVVIKSDCQSRLGPSQVVYRCNQLPSSKPVVSEVKVNSLSVMFSSPQPPCTIRFLRRPLTSSLGVECLCE